MTPPDGVLSELLAREPLFHRLELIATEEDLQRYAAPGFWEIGASGRVYDRDHVLAVVRQRQAGPAPSESWSIDAARCDPLGSDTYLLSYTLDLDGRVTRRTTIWRRASEGWQVLFHQGTVVASG